MSWTARKKVRDEDGLVEGFGDLVSIKELSRVVGMDRSNTLKYIKRIGVSV